MRMLTMLRAAGLIVLLGAVSAQAAVIDYLKQLDLKFDNKSLNTYTVRVDGIPVLQAGQLTNLAAVGAALAAKADFQTGTKAGGIPFASLTLKNDVNVSIFSGLTQVAAV